MSRFLGGLPRFPWSISESWINRSFQKTATNAPNTENGSVGHHNRSPILPLPSDFSQQDWQPTDCDGLGKYRTPHSIRSLARFPGAKGLFFRPHLAITRLWVIEGQQTPRGRRSVFRGMVENLGEPARQITVSLLIAGLIDPTENLCWPDVSPPFTPRGDCKRIFPEIGKNLRGDFDIASRLDNENWVLGIQGWPELKTKTRYECLLNLREGTTGGNSYWEFVLIVGQDGMLDYSQPKKLGRFRLAYLSQRWSKEGAIHAFD